MNCLDNTYLDEQITRTKALIDAYYAAELAITAGQMQSYTLNTGQTTQSVTQSNLAVLSSAIDTLYKRLETLCQRRYGTGTVVGRPAW